MRRFLCRALRLVEHGLDELSWRVELLADRLDDEHEARCRAAMREAGLDDNEEESK